MKNLQTSGLFKVLKGTINFFLIKQFKQRITFVEDFAIAVLSET